MKPARNTQVSDTASSKNTTKLTNKTNIKGGQHAAVVTLQLLGYYHLLHHKNDILKKNFCLLILLLLLLFLILSEAVSKVSSQLDISLFLFLSSLLTA